MFVETAPFVGGGLYGRPVFHGCMKLCLGAALVFRDVEDAIPYDVGVRGLQGMGLSIPFFGLLTLGVVCDIVKSIF